MTTITIRGPQSEILPHGLGGPNPPKPLRDWFEYAKGQDGVKSQIDGTMQVLTVPLRRVTTQMALLCLSQGFEVHGAPWFIVLDAEVYVGPVPEGIHNRLDADDTPVTWADWHDSTHTHMTAADGRMIVGGNSWGEELTYAEVVALLSAGYTLVLGADVAGMMG